MVLVSLSVICSVCIANVHHRTPGKLKDTIAILKFWQFEFRNFRTSKISPKCRKYYFKRFIQCRIGCIKYFCKHFRQVWDNLPKLSWVVATKNVSLESYFLSFFDWLPLFFQAKFYWWKNQLCQNQFFLLVTDFQSVANIHISIINTFPSQVLHCHMFPLNKVFRGTTKGKSTSRTGRRTDSNCVWTESNQNWNKKNKISVTWR